MLNQLTQIRMPSFRGMRSVLAKGLAALTDAEPISHPVAVNWLVLSPLMQYRFTNFDLFLMDQDLTSEWEGMQDPEGGEDTKSSW